ncbi:hypothetical protein D3C86_1684760 [compost metagenome]
MILTNFITNRFFLQTCIFISGFTDRQKAKNKASVPEALLYIWNCVYGTGMITPGKNAASTDFFPDRCGF